MVYCNVGNGVNLFSVFSHFLLWARPLLGKYLPLPLIFASNILNVVSITLPNCKLRVEKVLSPGRQIQAKIARTKDLIRDEQTSRDNNVNEYLKLSANAERQQQNRIKQVWPVLEPVLE